MAKVVSPERKERIMAFIRKHCLIMTRKEIAVKVSVNKKTIDRYMATEGIIIPPEIVAKRKGFQKGHKPGNTKPIGSRRTRLGFVEEKIANRTWILVHRKKWKAKHGAIPKGHCVIHKNGNKLDNRLGNLRLISYGELMSMNRYKMNHGKELSDNYIIGVLSRYNSGIKEIIRKENRLIELKRRQLLLKREIEKKRNNEKG